VGDSKGLRRPEGVYGGALIKAENDMDMLDYMFRDVVLPRRCCWWSKEKNGDTVEEESSMSSSE
jgi:hypothetical protein